MELEKRRKWSKIAAIGMGIAAVLSVAAGFFQGWNVPRILMTICFSASSVLYYVQYNNLLKED
jgi:hypothetical protein